MKPLLRNLAELAGMLLLTWAVFRVFEVLAFKPLPINDGYGRWTN